MPENPLLPDDELRALLALTRRCASLEAATLRKKTSSSVRGSRRSLPGREAVLSATTLQLGAGDLLLSSPEDTVASQLAPKAANGKDIALSVLLAPWQGSVSRLQLGAAMALSLRMAGTDRVVATMMQAREADAEWPSALAVAQQALSPLVIVCLDGSAAAPFTGGKTSPRQFAWANVSATAAKLKLPLLTVDGEDAVAMYRTVQEAILRARMGGGPALLWAALPTAAEWQGCPRNRRPVARLAAYLRARNIPLA